MDPMFDPVLDKRVIVKGKSKQLMMADKSCDFDDRFTLYLITRLPNPHFSPELQAQTTVVDFTVTMSGLEDQLLVDICGHERPDLEQQKDELTVAIANDKKELKAIEDKILHLLATNEGGLIGYRKACLGKTKGSP